MNIKTATFALLAATAAAVPLSAVDTTFTVAPEPAKTTEVTRVSLQTRTTGGVEACVMPSGCVDKAKYNTIPGRLPQRATPPPLPTIAPPIMPDPPRGN